MTARGWMLIGAGVATCAVILAAWLPFSALIAQRHALVRGTRASWQADRAEQAARWPEKKRLSMPDEIARIAREQYQLVSRASGSSRC